MYNKFFPTLESVRLFLRDRWHCKLSKYDLFLADWLFCTENVDESFFDYADYLHGLPSNPDRVKFDGLSSQLEFDF